MPTHPMAMAPVDLADTALWCNGFPDELFGRLRRERPVFHHELTDNVARTVKRDFWITTKHRHSVRLHRDIDAFTAADGPLIQGVGLVGSLPTVITMDPPELLSRRRVMSHAFTPKAVGRLEEGIRARAAALVDQLLAAGGGDWIADLADVLPMTVIGDIIGIPEADRPHIFDALDRILAARSPSPEDFQIVFTYASELTADKRRHPAEDIWSTLACATEMPGNELEIFFFVLAFAGSDTTKSALAAGLQAFIEHPEQIGRYRTEPAVRPGAVEEVLRWATPVTFWTRTAKVDVEMDGVRIPKGDRVVSMLRSANRDEDVFANPFTFDIGRDHNPHVAFGGGGPHHCLGAMLARAEIRAVLDELLCRADDIVLGPVRVTHPDLTNNMSVYDAMPVTLRPR